MAAATHGKSAHQLWVQRLTIPAYRVAEAARYADTSTQTINNWQKIREAHRAVIGPRARRASLSYLQLIEVGVVAAMRKSGVKLTKIRNTREYLARKFASDFPFAEYRFKHNGRDLFVSEDQFVSEGDKDKLVVVSESGQLAWNQILSRLLSEFEYDEELEKAVSWKVDGEHSPIRIDPRIAFGAPQVNGIPTWALRERWNSGESLADIADDYCLEKQLVSTALRFEGVEIDPDRPNLWVH